MKKKNTIGVASHGHGGKTEATVNAQNKLGKQEVNLRKNGFLHFQIGLILALIMVYFGMEAFFETTKTTSVPSDVVTEIPLEYYPELENIKVEKEKLPMPKKVTNPTKLIISKKGGEIDPGPEVVQPATDGEGDHIPLDSIAYMPPEEEDIAVPIDALREVPVFPGCEKVSLEERKSCFQRKMTKHVKRVFRYPEVDITLKNEGKVHVLFWIGKDGSIGHIQMRGPSATMEKEAKRIISKLPKMTPGKKNGKAVNVSFYIPINFQLQN